MHVILEGTLPYTLKNMFKVFSLDKANSLCRKLTGWLVHLILGIQKCQISHRRSLLIFCRMMALQGNQLHRCGRKVVLPLLLRSVVDFKSDVWQCYIKLLTIISVSFSPFVKKSEIPRFTREIIVYLELFKKCVPNATIIPKQHCMCHFPEQILSHGPRYVFGVCVSKQNIHIFSHWLAKQTIKIFVCTWPRNIS